MNKEKISYEITFNKDLFATQYLDHHGYHDPTLTQGTCSDEPGQLMVPKGSKKTISESCMISLLECDGASVSDRDEFTDLPLCYSYSLKDICNIRKITTWTQVEDNWKDARLYDKDSVIGYKGSINCATQIDDYRTKIHNRRPNGPSGPNHHNPTYHQDYWMKIKDTHTFNTEFGRWMEKKKKSKKELV